MGEGGERGGLNVRFLFPMTWNNRKRFVVGHSLVQLLNDAGSLLLQLRSSNFLCETLGPLSPI